MAGAAGPTAGAIGAALQERRRATSVWVVASVGASGGRPRSKSAACVLARHAGDPRKRGSRGVALRCAGGCLLQLGDAARKFRAAVAAAASAWPAAEAASSATGGSPSAAQWTTSGTHHKAHSTLVLERRRLVGVLVLRRGGSAAGQEVAGCSGGRGAGPCACGGGAASPAAPEGLGAASASPPGPRGGSRGARRVARARGGVWLRALLVRRMRGARWPDTTPMHSTGPDATADAFNPTARGAGGKNKGTAKCKDKPTKKGKGNTKGKVSPKGVRYRRL